jgi:hypothetical protein
VSSIIVETSGNQERRVAQASKVSFELHTLGWEAFQNLCGHVAREVLGQTATIFSSTNDAGRDGGFQGVWKKKSNEAYHGNFVLQCKFTARRDEHLSASDLDDEVEKARRLAAMGAAQTYLLITNAKVSGESDLRIREIFKQINGMQFFDILGEEWITQSILASKVLRAFVPRIYGLGDLSQILDERAYRQAEEILRTWRDNLTKFVPTAAHERSVRALMDKGFVLLLGDPMAGKSTIAASLALAASDRWNCLPVFVRNPDDLAHWNPDEPHQFFWVDDAFGQIQMESNLTAAWNRVMPHLSAAIRKGARILFTSRTYIYRAALKEIKESAFPLLRDSQVVINVEQLTLTEKERILYNHLRLGSQSLEFRREIKSFLPSIAASQKFFPEVAKRLGDPFFTKHLSMDSESLRRFVEEPKEFLFDVIKELDRANFASLALLFMRGGRVQIPPKLESNETEALALLGATVSQLFDGFRALDGSLVSQEVEGGEYAWKFRHPTVRDAMALHVAARPELLDIYLGGVKATELLSEVVCGGKSIDGAKVYIPDNRFAIVVEKIRELDLTDWGNPHRMLGFLSSRCSDEFLSQWIEVGQSQLDQLYNHFSVSTHSFCYLLSRLKGLGKLPSAIRSRYVCDVQNKAICDAEATFVADDIRGLLTNEEFSEIIALVKSEVVRSVSIIVEQVESEYDDPEYDPSDHFDELRSNFRSFQDYFFEDDKIYSAFEDGIEEIKSAVKRIEIRNEEARREKEDEEEKEKEEREMQEMMEKDMSKTMRVERQREVETRQNTSSGIPSIPPRSIFDDVDA